MKRVPDLSGNEENDTWELYKRIIVKEIPIFNKVVMQYYFKLPKKYEHPDSIIFAKADCIFELNFETEAITTLHTVMQEDFTIVQP